MGIVIRSWLVCVRNVKFMIVVAAGAPCSAVPAADCRTFLLKITLSSCKLLTVDVCDDDYRSIDIFTLAPQRMLTLRSYCSTDRERGEGNDNDNDDVTNAASGGSCKFLIR